MSEQLTIIQGDILSVGDRPETDTGIGVEAALWRVLRRGIPLQGRFKILAPYPAGACLCILLEMNPLLELVCLAAPEQLGIKKEERKRMSFVEDEIRSFRAAADFDMVFCSLPRVEDEADRLAEDLCHCRMLLRPGGQLFLHVRNYKEISVLARMILRKRSAVTGILARAGLSSVVEWGLLQATPLFRPAPPFPLSAENVLRVDMQGD